MCRDTFWSIAKRVAGMEVLPGVTFMFILAPQVVLLFEEAGLATGFFLPAIQALWVSGASVVAF